MKNALLAIILSLYTTPLLAQVKFGLKAGGMLSNVAAEGIGLSSSGNQAETKFSYLTGVAAILPIHQHFRVHAELLYSNKGALGDIYGRDYSNNYHYLSLPLLLRYQVIDRLSVGIGPELDYLFGVYQRSEAGSSFPMSSYYKPLDLGINLDVQYDLLDKLSLGLRYNLGVYDITERLEGTTFEGTPFVVDSNVYNRSLQLSLFYWF